MAPRKHKPPTQRIRCARCPKNVTQGQRYLRTDDGRIIHYTCGNTVERGHGLENGLLTGIIPLHGEEAQPEIFARKAVAEAAERGSSI